MKEAEEWAQGAPLAVGVLDVEPNDVIRDVVLIEAGVHCPCVSFVVVIPTALVVAVPPVES